MNSRSTRRAAARRERSMAEADDRPDWGVPSDQLVLTVPELARALRISEVTLRRLAEVLTPSVGSPAPRARVCLSPQARREVERAARRFLAGYLPLLYGRAKATTVQPVTRALADALRRSHARVPPAARSRQPRVAA